MKVGYFERIETKDEPDRFGGKIELVGVLSGAFRMVKATEKRKSNSPDYEVEIYHGNDWARAGSAWYQEPRGGGDKFFSVVVDLPALGKPQRFSVFEADADEQPEDWKKGDPCHMFNAVWSRPRPARSLAGAGTGGDPLAGDAIPY